MKEYIISVVIGVIISGFVCAASPHSGGIDKFIRFITAVAVTAIIIIPFGLNTTELTDSLIKGEYGYGEYEMDYCAVASQSLAMSVEQSVKSNFSDYVIKKIVIQTVDGQDFEVENITVYIEPTAADTATAAEYLSEIYNCSITIKAV